MPEILIFSFLVIFAAAFLAPSVIRVLGDRGGWLLSLAPFGALAGLLSLSGAVADGGFVAFHLEWFRALDVSIDLRLDGLSLMMVVLICGIGGSS